MRYELKDKERQAALEKALPGIAEKLQWVCERDSGKLDETLSIMVSRTNPFDPLCKGEWVLSLPTVDLEVIGKYNSAQWNEYPKVTPPEGVPMRVEYTVPLMTVFQRGGIAVFEDGHWYECTPDGRHRISQFKNGRRVVQFRPWDDEK
jgi:hypothetical protein